MRLVGLRRGGTGRKVEEVWNRCYPKRKDRLGWDRSELVTKPPLPPWSMTVTKRHASSFPVDSSPIQLPSHLMNNLTQGIISGQGS